ncbi:MAG: ABC transporter substrate-binding protein [Hyphomicrobiaceae bacterium]
MPVCNRFVYVSAVLAAVFPSTVRADTPKTGGTLNFAVVAEPPNYDCHASQTFALLHPISPFYSHLVRYDSSQGGKIVGDLAQSWTIAPDGLTYTFKLHDGVTFHDGSALTSADVKATFERIANPPTGVVSLRKSTLADVAGIDTPDPTTVVFKLRNVNASMLDNLASPFNCVFSAAKLQGDPKFPEQNILGSGAFQFVEYIRGSHLTAKRFDGYFRKGLPYLEGYKAYFVKSNAVVPGMLGGQFDVEFRGRTPSERDQLMNSQEKEKWILHEGPWATVNTVIFNTTKKPFDDPRVRRALSLAIDRWVGNESLSKVTFVKATGGFLRPGFEYALPRAELEKLPGYGKNIEKSRAEARRLLKEAGQSRLRLVLHNRTVAEPYTPVGVFLIDQWRRIGVTVEHSQVETTPYFGNLVEGKFDVALYPVTVPADEVTAQHQSYLTNTKSPISYSRHKDTKLDDLWDQQGRTLDPAKRKVLVHDFERHLMTENYTLSVNWWQRIVVHHKKLKGWHFSPSHFQGQDLVNVWLDE